MIISEHAAWLLLVFSLPANQASKRVEIWRKLRKYGALPLRSSGYLLPNLEPNREHFEWLAAMIRKYKGQASVIEVRSVDNLPVERLRQMFIEARSRDYESLAAELKKLVGSAKHTPAQLSRVRRRFQETTEIDFFTAPLRSRVESLLARADDRDSPLTKTSTSRRKKGFTKRVWMTRPRPGVDRVASGWLIRRFIDPDAQFVFTDEPAKHAEAIPFDMFHGEGFSHRGDDCTFETLQKEFGIRDPKVKVIAQIIHDADLGDEKFGRIEGIGIDRVLIGMAHQDLSDEELLRRGAQMIEGLYQAISRPD